MPQPRGNRLAGSTSPYLRQHAHQPVDWWPWGPDAFERARVRQVPVLLSVGYSACHWCHVMAHESFEDEQLAVLINEGFVPVKVDREERPDIDAVYLTATHLTTGSAGWPMTVFLTPDAEPFHCGTYYPRDRFHQILTAVRQAWLGRRDEVLASAAHLTAVVRSSDELGGHEQAGLVRSADDGPDEELLADALAAVAESADPQHGGFGQAPKFPMAMVLEALLRHHRRTGSARALELVRDTCEAMARGGLYDQLTGGFARYSVDAGWRVPHFEKMLYDNALLARVYLHWWQVSGEPLARRVAMETCDWIVATMTTPQGGFASALDADTDGVEGATYLWTPEQLTEVLGPHDGGPAAQLLGVTGVPSTELGWTLTLARDPVDRAPGWWEQVRGRLAAARAARPQPARDGKVVTAWNGLAIAALAEAGAVFQAPHFVAAARRAADHLLAHHRVDGRLLRSSLEGRTGEAAGVAADYGDLAEGLLTLHQVTGEPSDLDRAGELLDVALAHLGSDDGGFFDTLDDHSDLVTRPRSTSDSPEPSGQAALAHALLTYGHLTASPDHLRAGRLAVAAGLPLVGQAPLFAGWTWAAAEALADGPVQVAVSDVGPGADALWSVAVQSYRPGRIVVRGRPDSRPLLAGRPGVGSTSAAYVCRGTVCGLPLTDPDALANELRGR